MPVQPSFSPTPNRVAEVRRNLGIKQMTLAHKLGVSQPYLSMVERGRSYAGAGARKRLALALGVPEAELFPAPTTAGSPQRKPRPRARRAS